MSKIVGKCPFCESSNLKLVTSETLCGYNGLDEGVYRHKAYVRCMRCNARGPLASGRVMYISHELPEWAEDLLSINYRAIDLFGGRELKEV